MQTLRIAQSKEYIRLGASFPENRNRVGFWNVVHLSKITWWIKVHKKIVSVNFSHALFSLLDFLTLEDGADRLSRNISKELLQVLHNTPMYCLFLCIVCFVSFCVLFVCKCVLYSLPPGGYPIAVHKYIIYQECRSHMTMWQCRPWFGSMWSGSEWSSLMRSGSALHTQI
jgi:hypothetical protein